MNRHTNCIVTLLILCPVLCFGENLPVGSRIRGDESVLRCDLYDKSEITVISNGYLFINGRYIEMPYNIQRIGQGVVINDLLVNVPYTEDIEKVTAKPKHWTEAGYGFKIDTPKQVADRIRRSLTDDLGNNGVVVVDTSYTNVNKRFPSANMLTNELSVVVTFAAVETNVTKRVAEVKRLGFKGFGPDGSVEGFCREGIENKQLRERLGVAAKKEEQGNRGH